MLEENNDDGDVARRKATLPIIVARPSNKILL